VDNARALRLCLFANSMSWPNCACGPTRQVRSRSSHPAPAGGRCDQASCGPSPGHAQDRRSSAASSVSAVPEWRIGSCAIRPVPKTGRKIGRRAWRRTHGNAATLFCLNSHAILHGLTKLLAYLGAYTPLGTKPWHGKYDLCEPFFVRFGRWFQRRGLVSPREAGQPPRNRDAAQQP
jgi:hypothetical protein